MQQKIIILFYILLLSLNANSQNLCTISIKDSITQKTIFPASIVYFNQFNNSIDFSFSDDKGGFEIPNFDSTQRVTKIVIKSFGFVALEINVSNNLIPCGKTFYLTTSKNNNEIKVVAQNSKIIKPDTTIFNANNYKLGSEQNVENLLEKLPLVSINPNGDIIFKGKSIDLLSIEGDDLLGGRYQDYTKNVSANGIQSFEFIENYIDSIDKINGINNKKTILNIIYKKTKRLFSNINIATNPTVSNGQINSDIIKLGLKIKSISFINANNIGLSGSNAINNSDNLFAVKSTHFIMPYSFDPNNQVDLVQNFNIPQEKLQLNNSIIASFNIFKKRKTSVIFRQNIQFQLDKFNQQYTEQTNFNLGNNNLPSFNMQTNRDLRSFNVVSNTKIEKTIKNTWKNIKNLKIIIGKNNNVNNTIFQNVPLQQNLDKIGGVFKYTQQYVNVKKNPKIRGHYINASYTSNNGFYTLDSSNFFPSLFNSNFNSSQQTNSKTLQLNYEMQLDLNVFKQKVYSFFTINYLNNNFKTTFGDYENKKIIPSVSAFSYQSNKMETFFISFNNNKTVNISRRFYIELELNGIVGNKFGSNSKILAQILPKIKFIGTIGSKINCKLNYERLASLPVLSQVRNINYINGINSLYNGNSAYELYVNNNLSLQVDWRKQIGEHKFIYNSVTINSSFNKNPYLSKYKNFNQLIFIIDSSLINFNNNSFISYYKSYLNKKSSFELNCNINGFKNNFINETGIASNFNISNSADFSWKYTLPKKIFLQLNFLTSVNYNSDKLAINSFTKVFNSYSLKQKIEKKFGAKLNIQITNEYYNFKGSNNVNQQLNFLDSKVTYIINKKGASIAIQARNITNVNTLIEQFNTGISNQTNTYFLFPRLFLLRANFPL